MGRPSLNIERCSRCRQHLALCFCHQLPTYDLATKVVLIMHKREYVKVSATGPLALACLPNSALLIHGRRENPIDLAQLDTDERRLLFLFPRSDAQVLTAEFAAQVDKPITLIVPDGNWRQAFSMARRLPGIERATPVTLPMGQQSKWGLRRETFKDGLATFEAISKALGIIESMDVQAGLDKLFDTMVRQTRTRGRFTHKPNEK